MKSNNIVDEILTQYVGLTPYSAVPLCNHGGFSGARIWRVDSAIGILSLKAWPPNVTAAGLRTIHQQMHIAKDAGQTFVPAVLPTASGDTCTIIHGRTCDLTTWMPGVPDFRNIPSATRLQATCIALANLHNSWSNTTSTAVCPGVRRRLQCRSEWNQFRSSIFRPPDEARSRWQLVDKLMSRVFRSLVEWNTVKLPVQPCLCDIWHDHVLYTGEEVTGVIDYGAMKTDHVAVDLARLLGSMVPGDQNMIDVGLQAYRSVRDLSANEERLMCVLEETGAICAGANWLRWLYGTPRKFDDEQAVRRRVDEVFRRLEALHASP